MYIRQYFFISWFTDLPTLVFVISEKKIFCHFFYLRMQNGTKLKKKTKKKKKKKKKTHENKSRKT